jgi:purine-binding chemotaxis protein CheW
MTRSSEFESKADELRAAFDQSFALPPPTATGAADDLLAVRVADHPYAIRLRDIDGMLARVPVVPVPAVARALLGIAGIRGEVVPVFALSPLLGYGHDPAAPWLVLCGDDAPVALAFNGFDGYLRLTGAAIPADEGLRATQSFVREVVRTDDGFRPVIEIPQLVAALRAHSQARQEKEQ